MHFFCLLFEVDQLAGGYFTIYYNDVLANHEQGNRKLSSRPVSHGSDVFFFDC